MLNSNLCVEHKQSLCNMIKTRFNDIVRKLIAYTKVNWGFPFIVGFIVLLLGSAVSLSDVIAVFSYYALIIGVVLQLVCFLRDEKRLVEVEGV